MIPSDYAQCNALTQPKAHNKEGKKPSKNTRKCTKGLTIVRALRLGNQPLQIQYFIQVGAFLPRNDFFSLSSRDSM